MDELLYRGSIIRFKFYFESEQEEEYMIVDNFEKEFPFQLICISGYKAGTIGGYVKQENIEKDLPDIGPLPELADSRIQRATA
jgi:hypothetical protein